MTNQAAYSLEANWLKTFFSLLEENGIRYGVLRNCEDIPNSIGDSDLDIWVDPNDREIFFRVLDESLSDEFSAHIGFYETVAFLKISLIGCNSGRPEGWWGVCLDVNFGVTFRGAHYLNDAATPCALCKNSFGVSIFQNEIGGVLGILKELLHNGTCDSRYEEDARSALSSKSEVMREVFDGWYADSVKDLDELLNSCPSRERIQSIRNRIKSRIIRSNIKRGIFAYYRRRISFSLSKLLRYLKPSGCVLSIHGADQIGKVGIITQLLPVIGKATHDTFKVKELRPSFMPTLSLFKDRQVSQGPEGGLIGPVSSGRLVSCFRLLYLWLDYQLGYWFKVRPLLAKGPTVWLFERYYWDILVDPIRYGVKLPHWIINLAFASLPKPHFSVCLCFPADSFSDREEELNDEDNNYKEGCSFGSNDVDRELCYVAADTSESELKDQVFRLFITYLKRRALTPHLNLLG